MIPTDQLGIQMVDELAKDAYDILLDGEVSFGEIVRLGGSLASKASRFVQLSGHQKQSLVIRAVEVALEKVVKDKIPSLPEDQRVGFAEKVQRAAQFAKETLPSVLDVAVSAARGKLDLGTVVNKKTCWTSLKLLLRCAGVQVPELPTPVKNFLEDQKEVSDVTIEMVSHEKTAQTVVEATVEVPVATETTPTPLPSESEPKSEESSESVPV